MSEFMCVFYARSGVRVLGWGWGGGRGEGTSGSWGRRGSINAVGLKIKTEMVVWGECFYLGG